jgi:transketolase
MTVKNKTLNQEAQLELCKKIRANILKMSTIAGSGHPTSSLSGVEIMVSLLTYSNLFRCDWNNFTNPDNDRLIFSKGHASPLYYSLFCALGLVSEEDLMTFRRFDSNLEGHPTPRFPFTEVTTGSLGQGLGVGLGMALSGRVDKREFKTWVLMGDSEMAEGSVWEAVQLAGFEKMSNLIAIVDCNRLGQRGQTMTAWKIEQIASRFDSFDWKTILVEEGNNIEKTNQAVEQASLNKDKPTAIIVKTKKGAGISFLTGTAKPFQRPIFKRH